MPRPTQTPLEKFLPRLGVVPLRLGVALLLLSQATIPVFFFLRLISGLVTLLLDFQWKIIRHKIGLIENPKNRMKGSIQV